MVRRVTFIEAWKRICRRFSRQLDEQEAEEYYAFIQDRMSEEQFQAAAQAVWATARFFPRPADFLSVEAGREWRAVLELATSGWDPFGWDELSPQARKACEALGGLSALGASRDVARARAAWLEAYELEIHVEASKALPAQVS